MGKEHLGVAQHAEHLNGGDGKAHQPVQSPPIDGGAKKSRCLQGSLHKQTPGQGLVAHRGEGQAQQITEKAPFEQLGRLPFAGSNRSVQGAAAAHHEPAMPKAPEQHEKGQGGEGEPWSQTECPLGIGGELAPDLAEEEHPHHHDAEGQLTPKPHPAHAPESCGNPVEVKGFSHGVGQLCTNLPWEDQGSESKAHP